ncbi:MAG: recombinase family protein, partial [Dehalococcoidales bacterium]|nr:recombinase family protein [Dehalococcoidales bacterium]
MQKRIIDITPEARLITDKKRVAAYARVSSDKDAMLHSLAAQIDFYRNYIIRNPEWEFAGVYADEAKTGTKDSREQFQKLLADCRSGYIDMVVTKSISRFARNTVTLLKTVRELKELGVNVFFEDQNIDSISEEGELMLTLMASVAQEESLSCSDNCKWRIRKGFEQGQPNTCTMLGYRLVNGDITVIPDEAVIVREI